MSAEGLISLIVPCRNEAAFIAAFVESALAQQLPPGQSLELVVAEGMSDDGTREWLQACAAREPRLRLVENPGRIVSTGLNLAAAAARGAVLVRLDVHTTYAPDYVAQCVLALAQTGAACVGGPWLPVGTGWPQAAIAAAFQSRFGSGGAASRRLDHSGPVDTVYLGAWRRETLLASGGFDETLVRNQDDELNLRLHRVGGLIWQSAAIRSRYAPRASFKALFRQFFQYGYWKVPVIRKHRLPASPRQLAPFGLVATLSTLGFTGLFWSPAAFALVGVLLAYASASAVNAFAVAPQAGGWRGVAGVAWACACMHVGYGLGFALGLFDLARRRRAPGAAATRLTR